MVFLLVSLSVYLIMKLVEEVVSAPPWFLILLSVGLSAAGLALAGGNPGWCAAVAALAGFWALAEALLLALRDWARVSLLSRGMRR